MLEVQRSTVYSFDAVGNVIIIGDRIVWRTNVNYRCCSWNNDIMAWQLKQLNVAEGLMDLSQRVSSETCWNQTIKFLDIVQ